MYIPLTFEGALQKCLFASGGYEGFYISGSTQYKYHWFTGSAQLTVQKGSIDNVQIYVIGGGGGGGNRSVSRGAGGGGGGGVNYVMNGRLFQGTYNVVVGKGGDDQTTSNSDGFDGSPSSFIGSNLSMVAGGGGGGKGNNSSTGGTGGVPNGGSGGNGGISTAGSGNTGLIIYLDGISNGFGCGGGGAEDAFSGQASGYSCGGEYGRGGSQSSDSTEGAPYYGMGGGGGNDSRIGRRGGSGSVLIQYPIYDYCNNHFNETGSCGCKQITFDSTNPGAYDPYIARNYLYTPCGGNQLVSGSVIAYFPISVCATSGTFYFGPTSNTTNTIGYVDSSLTTQCSTGSVCGSNPTFTPTCSSSYMTYWNPLGTTEAVYYVPRSGSLIDVEYLPRNSGSYICSSNGYPNGITNNNMITASGVKCFALRYQRSIAVGSGTQTLYWRDCSNTLQSATFGFPGSYNFVFTASFATESPYMTTNFTAARGLSFVAVYSDYAGSVPDCGCP